ncbi:dipeptide epimerase [Alteriqipengyuania lutimaris]|uniref:Dipeptide epimerase n=1 Tax=Alteriqipengyuania lutimaris TaxID=1538146 RepID=A0A395LN03_9SPHN|nr:dipeptide epimerase [Alteriqipengyuania lutimaris]MBB3032433.1 L-alanine-DL-glutamate epimerase-like enolase superfamily enzyme [Alteriqipengyuania lutimaris]RDS78426.1 dipeptide epimerase [Alteriqipengyuania lutimaris]
MPGLKLEARRETLRLAAPFRISGHVFENCEVVVATLSDGAHEGRGEGGGVYYLGDDADNMMADIEAARGVIEAGIDRKGLLDAMPAGGGRNAIDCALWELEARRTATPTWQMAGIDAPLPVVTTFTLGADTPEAMAAGASRYRSAKAIKIKLTGDLALDIARVRAIREARGDVWLMVDANQGFALGELDPLVSALAECRVSLLEQPLARGREGDLEGFECPIPLAADESALTSSDVEALAGRFSVFNIKLDKCGGLTEALRIARLCRQHGLQVMVGNMVGSSLAMAPAYILAQLCDYVDLDGPTFLAKDREPSLHYEDGMVSCGQDVWGYVA